MGALGLECLPRSVVDGAAPLPYYPADRDDPRCAAAARGGNSPGRKSKRMSWRKWLVRFLVFAVLGGGAVAVLLYQRYTDPAAVRQQVVEQLERLFPGATVSLDSARLHLFGGITLRELRLLRRDDPDLDSFLHVPAAVIYIDKEHLGDGKLAFRKVVFEHPRFRLQRGRDGRCNLENLVAPTPSSDPLPILVIKQGTFVFEDRQAPPGTPPVEVTGVNLTLINDPLPSVTFEGSGTSESLGAIRLHGTWQRDSRAASLSLQADGVALTPLLVQRLAACRLDLKGLEPFALEGRADLKAEVEYQPGSGVPLGYDVRWQVRQAKVGHPKLPFDLENVEAAGRCVNGRLTVERLTATSGPAQLELLKGTAVLGRGEPDFDAVLSVKHLPLDQKLYDRLPEGVQVLAKNFNPQGPATVQVRASRRDGRWLQHQYTLLPENLRVCYKDFHYPADRITGAVEYDHLDDLTRVHIEGQAGGQPVTLRGTWKGHGLDAEARLELTATGLYLSKELLGALPEGLRKLAESFHATGRCHGKALFLHSPGVAACQATYHVQFFDTAVRWDHFPIPLEKVSGLLEIYPNLTWEFRDFRGTHHGGEVAVAGRTFPPAQGAPAGTPGRLVLEIGGKDIPLDRDFKEALQPMPKLALAWATFAPAGKLSFTAKIDRLPGKPDDTDIRVDVRGCSIEPTFFKYVLHDLSGEFRYARDQLTFTRVTARHDATRLVLEKGVVDLYANGGFYADLADLRGNPVRPDDQFLAALPEGLRTAMKGLGLRDPFAVQTRLVIAQTGETGGLPDVFWDGQMWVRGAKLQVGVDVEDVTGTLASVGRHNGRQLLGVGGNLVLQRATVFGQPFHDVHAHLRIKEASPDVLTLGLWAPVHGGEVSGQARVDFHSDLKYELNLTASQVKLEDFGRHNFGPKSQLSGIAAARLHLTGDGSGTENLKGNGNIDIPYTALTKLYNLPLLLDLLKFLGLRWPDRTLFEEAHAQFSVEGQRVHIGRLDLLGNVISLWGRGEVNLDGTDVHLDFYPSWARLEQLLPAGVRSIPPAISKTLLKIEVRGKVTGGPKDLQFHKKPIPVLVDPLLQMRDLVSGKKSGAN